MRPTLRDLLTLAWPVVVSRATQTVVGLCDAVMVAHLGPAALAATTAGAQNSFVLFILPMGTVFIVQSFASQLFGKGDASGARRYGVYGLLVALITQVIAVAAIPLIAPALSLFPYSPDVLEMMTSYMTWRLLSSGAVVGVEALGNYYGGLGDTRTPMIANIVAMVLNVGLNAILIDGLFGLPALGVTGAAIASVISTCVIFVGLLVVFVREGPWPRFVASELTRMLRFGLPSGINWFLEFSAFVVFVNVVVADLGTVTFAALMAVMQINAVSFMPAFGLASSGAILVGQQIGRGDRDDVPRLVGLTFGAAVVWQGFLGLAYALFPALIFSPFAREAESQAQMMEAGTRMLVLAASWQIFDSGATVLAEGLRAAGDTAWPLYARVVLAWVLFLPGSWLAVSVLRGGDVAAMLALVVYIAALAAVLWWRFRRGHWRAIELTEPELA